MQFFVLSLKSEISGANLHTLWYANVAHMQHSAVS